MKSLLSEATKQDSTGGSTDVSVVRGTARRNDCVSQDLEKLANA